MTDVKDVMSQNVHTVRPTDTLREAAMLMAKADTGALPVEDDDRLVGMLTDRDIAVRATANGLGVDTPVGDVMTAEILYCFEDQPVAEVARNMADLQVRRLPVVDRDKRLTGIVAVADLAQSSGTEPAGVAVAGISDPTPQHSQRA